MTEREAESLVELMRELWTWKGGWNASTIGLWVESLARPDWNADQCEAVIRDERRQDDGAKPRMKVILARCYEAHKTTRKRVENPGGLAPITDAEWAVIHADREAAAAWWFEQSPEDRARTIAEATAAFPMFPAKWDRMGKADRLTPIACVQLKAAWQTFHDRGPWQGTGAMPLLERTERGAGLAV